VPARDDSPLDIAVLVPCRDEEATVAKVVADFREVLPTATVYVYDNGSTDQTAKVAAEAGAVVRTERRPGKGHVVARMLADIDADVYVMVDGDDTYDATVAPAMVDMLLDGPLDLVTGVRRALDEHGAYRRGHVLGNRLFTGLHRRLFGDGCSDVFSGYRVMSRRLAKSFPARSSGFEIETELTAHALELGAPMGELDCDYAERPAGSESKLRTYRDGTRILRHSLGYFKDWHPLQFFGTIGVALALFAIVLGIPIVIEYADSHTVPRFPTAIVTVGMMVVACMSVTCGIILDSLSKGRREAKRLRYLGLDPPARRSPG
jgi:glycosyltransferase involved in cell wall biosynthesis